MADIGENIAVEVKGKVATFTIDLSKNLRQSASGKNTIVATTGGNVKVPGTEVTVGFNAYHK